MDEALRVAFDLKDYGRVRRGFLNIDMQELTPELAKAFNLPTTEGTLIARVMPDGAADKAGMLAGDVILQIDDQLVKKPMDLVTIISKTKPGTLVEVKISRKGKPMSITALTGELSAEKTE